MKVTNRPTLLHRIIVKYICGSLEKKEKKEIQKAIKEDDGYDLLFQLIDGIKQKVRITKQAEIEKVPSTFAALEELLLQIISGNTKPEDEQQFLDGLMCSPLFYQRALMQLAGVREPALDDVPEMAGVEIKSDDQILSQFIEEAKTEPAVAKVASRNIGEKSWVENLFASLRRIPGYAYAIMAAALAITVLLRTPIFDRDIASAYVYDDEVPFEYTESSLRSGQVVTAEIPEIPLFVNQFKLGMADYMIKNYENAIGAFENLQSAAQTLRSKSTYPKVLQYIHDYFFYLGVSHLAVSRSQSRHLSGAERTKHYQQAIASLSQAQSLASENNLNLLDRDTYFLGVAYGFGGKPDAAITALEKINIESSFYNNSNNLIQQWSKNN